MRSVEKKVYLGLLVCVLVSMLGVSFAYFTAGATSVSGSGGNTGVSTPSDLIHVAYDAGSSSLTLPVGDEEYAKPGDKASKTFTITVTPTAKQKSVKYAIQLVIDSNNFVKCTAQTAGNKCVVNAKELSYTLKEGSTVIKTGDLLDLNVGTNTLGEISHTVDSAVPYTYTLEVEYIDTNADQNHNMNKTFSANVKVVFAE